LEENHNLKTYESSVEIENMKSETGVVDLEGVREVVRDRLGVVGGLESSEGSTEGSGEGDRGTEEEKGGGEGGAESCFGGPEIQRFGRKQL
jgi:hypothetical protein